MKGKDSPGITLATEINDCLEHYVELTVLEEKEEQVEADMQRIASVLQNIHKHRGKFRNRLKSFIATCHFEKFYARYPMQISTLSRYGMSVLDLAEISTRSFNEMAIGPMDRNIQVDIHRRILEVIQLKKASKVVSGEVHREEKS